MARTLFSLRNPALTLLACFVVAVPAADARPAHKHRATKVIKITRPSTGRTAAVPAPLPDPVGATTCADADLRTEADTLERARAATFCLVNAERTSRGLNALREDATLAAVASAKAADLVARGYFDHTTPGGMTFELALIHAGYVVPGTRFVVSENLAWGQTVLSTPVEVVRGWMGSPGHRANILNGRFTETGIGAVVGVPSSQTKIALPGATFAQEFGDHHLGAIG